MCVKCLKEPCAAVGNEQKFQVFVSSTYTDLIGERQDTLKSILDLVIYRQAWKVSLQPTKSSFPTLKR